jgi:hypothetical protein
MALLDIVGTAALELGLVQTAPTSVVGNTDPTITQLLALANREGKYMSRVPGQWSGWPELRVQYTFSMVTAGQFTGITTTRGSSILTGFSSTSGIVAGYGVSGGSILTGATVLSLTSNTVTLDTPAQSSTTGQNFVFGKIAYDMPADLLAFIPQTQWDRNFRWQMLGPVSPQEWQTIVSGISPVGPRIRFRVMGNKFYINPPPGIAQTDVLAFEYITKNWCGPNIGTTLAYPPTQEAWAADTDLYAWDQDTCILGIKWRYLAAKGLDYSEEKDAWTQARDLQIARSGTVRVLPLNSHAADNDINLLGSNNIPDTGFGA